MTTADTVVSSADAAPIMQLAMGFYGSRALMSAVELDLFAALAEGPLTRAELEQRVGLHPRAAADFLDALVSLGLLNRADGTYSNTELADKFLVPGRGLYVGGFAAMGSASLYPLWGKLTDLLRTGEPQIPPGGNFFQGLYQRPEAAKKFMDAMDAFNEEIARTLGELVDWSDFRSLVDVGGARGDLSARLVEANPDLFATCFDLPPVRALFNDRIAGTAVADRVTFSGGDFVSDELSPADVYVFGHILHGRDQGPRQDLVNRAFAGLKPGGVLFVYDRMIDDDRREKTLSLLGSLGMALVSPIGSEYTSATCARWLTDAGFGVEAIRPLAATDTVVVARKPA